MDAWKESESNGFLVQGLAYLMPMAECVGRILMQCLCHALESQGAVVTEAVTKCIAGYLDESFASLLPRDSRSAKRGIAIVSRPSVCQS